MERTENLVQTGVSWLRLIIEATGAVVVATGFVIATVLFARALLKGRHSDFTSIRLILARYLALALEFQLGADILSTAVAPTWDRLGKLAAIAVIRTALNFFLSKEMEVERQSLQGETVPRDPSAVPIP